MGSNSRDWEHQVPYFSQRYRVVTPDLRGHGKSEDPPGPYSILHICRDIAELIRSLSLAPAHVAGLSLGGFIAFQLAADHADLVWILVVVNSAPGLPQDRFRYRVRMTWAALLRRLIVGLFGMRALGRFLGRKLFPRAHQEELKRTFIERWAENDKRANLASLASVAGCSIEQRLCALTCPTCVSAGEHDFIPLGVKETYAADLPDARLLVIPGSGHFTPMDEPARFNEAVMRFLAEQG